MNRLAALLLAVLALPAAEVGIPPLRNYDGKDIAFGTTFYAPVQDRQGVLYFGSGGQLYEFDGVSWRVANLPGSSATRAVAIDAGGRIWLGGNAAVGYLEADATGTLRGVSLVDKIPPEHRAFNTVFQAIAAPQGVFFQSFERLFRWDGKRMHAWKSESRFQALSQVRDRLYTSQTGVGLQEIAGDEIRPLPGGDAFKNSRSVRLLAYDDRRMLVAALGEPLRLYDGETVTPFPTQADEYLAKHELRSASALPDGGFCLGTARGGAVLINHDGGLRLIVDQATGLPAGVVNGAFTDRDGALWLTHSAGITRIEANSPISTLSLDPMQEVVRHDGTLFASSLLPGRLLSRVTPNPRTGRAEFQPVPTTLQGGGRLLSFQDPAGKAPPQLLVGTAEGLAVLSGNSLKPVLPELMGPLYSVNRMLQSRQSPNRIFVALTNGLASLRWEAGKWVNEGRLPEYNFSISYLAEDQDGSLWAGGLGGAISIKVPPAGLRDAKFQAFDEKDGLEKGGVDLAWIAGRLIFSSQSQDLRRWDPATRTFPSDKEFFPVVKNSQYDSRVALPNGDVWATNRSAIDQRLGIYRRQPNGTYIFDEAPFRPLARLAISFALAEPDGVLWLAGRGGLFRFDQSRKTSRGASFQTLVRQISTGPDAIVFAGAARADAAALRLPSAQNSLRFEFAAPVFGGEGQTVYQYLLEGADREWSAWGKRTEANYSSLSPGDYRFRVRARDISGRLGEEGVYSFTILPPWYRSLPAYLGYALLLLLAARAARQRVIDREQEKARRAREALEAQAKLLEATVADRTREISERAAELATVNRITQALSTQLDKDALIQLVGDQIRDVFRAQIAYVCLLDRPANLLRFPYTFGEDIEPVPFGTGLASRVIRTGEPLLINEDLRGSSARLGVENVGRQAASYLGVPISSGGEIIGVVSVQTTDIEGRFTEADQRLLATIAASVGVAFHNARLFEDARQARAAAEEADAAKSTFLSTVSHELRTPLTSVLGFAKIIRKRLEERLFPLIPEDDKRVAQAKKQVADNLNVVVSEGERLTKLINDVLDLAKINAGKFTWNMEQLSIADVMDRALGATSSLFESKKLELIRDVAPNLPTLTGDSDRLIQVVINLVSNAVKFTDAGSVACAARLENGEIVVSVRDSGVGIKPEDQPKVFEKFKQVGDTLTDKPQGTGLGLPISKEIVEHHGGRMWVESEPGKGSTFYFSLPVHAKTTIDVDSLLRQLRENVATHQPRPHSILVVDDDAHIRSLLKQEFTEAGYTVRLAEDGPQALKQVREEAPGLIILDVMMPGMTGFEVAAALKNNPQTAAIPIIILSIVEDKERGFRLGVDRYLTKPIDTAALFHEVGALLDRGASNKKVLIVDDDTDTLAEALEARGYQVTSATGAGLKAKAIDTRPDVILLSARHSNDDTIRSLRFEPGLENVLFLIYQ